MQHSARDQRAEGGDRPCLLESFAVSLARFSLAVFSLAIGQIRSSCFSKEAQSTNYFSKEAKKVLEEAEEELEDIKIGMFLSEGWKEGDKVEEDSSGGIIGNVLKAVGVVVALIVFSQIPVGTEDLSKYSVPIKSALENSAKVTSVDLGDVNRVKNSGGGADL